MLDYSHRGWTGCWTIRMGVGQGTGVFAYQWGGLFEQGWDRVMDRLLGYLNMAQTGYRRIQIGLRQAAEVFE